MLLIPDKIFNSFEELTPQFLKENNISALILDIDNTLIPYEEKEPPMHVRNWLFEMQKEGIRIAFVTNNHKKRLLSFNSTLGLPAFANSAKPFLRNMKKALRALGATDKTTANMGDQIFTDVLAGKRLKIKTFLVPPIKDKRDPITRLKRFFEKRHIRAYYKRNPKEQL